MSEQNDIDSSLKTLIRGLTQNNIKEICAGHKALCKIGSSAVPHIRKAILQSNWSRAKYPNEIRYVSGLLGLLHDINETESREVANQLKRGGCDLAVAAILDSICRFTIADYVQYEVRGIKVFEHTGILTKQSIRQTLEHWLKNVPYEDLQEIERLYVLRKADLEVWGNYAPLLYNINLVWDNPCSRFNPVSVLNLFIIETTLYHEIGHHVHRHTFGQDPDQEKQAQEYADRAMGNSSHVLFRIARGMKQVLDWTISRD